MHKQKTYMDIKPHKFYKKHPAKMKKINLDSAKLVKTGVGLAFAGIALGAATKAFKDSFS